MCWHLFFSVICLSIFSFFKTVVFFLQGSPGEDRDGPVLGLIPKDLAEVLTEAQTEAVLVGAVTKHRGAHGLWEDTHGDDKSVDAHAPPESSVCKQQRSRTTNQHTRDLC